MVGTSVIHVSTSSVLLPSYLMAPNSQKNSINWLPCLNILKRPNNRVFSVKATSSGGTGNSQQQQPTSSSAPRSPFSVVLDVPKNIWRQTLRPLSDFGFGRKSIWEGGVGLFLVSGAVMLALSLAWLRGFQLRSRFRKYLAVFEFEQACGICTGTPVRIRGVNVGNVIRVNPSLKSIEAVVEVSKWRFYFVSCNFTVKCGGELAYPLHFLSVG